MYGKTTDRKQLLYPYAGCPCRNAGKQEGQLHGSGLVCTGERKPAYDRLRNCKQHYTTKGMAETKTFSVNIPSSGLLEKTDYCGMVSGNNTDKSGIFDVVYGSLKTAPMIRECPVTLECQLVQTVPLPTHNLYIGEISGAYANGRVIKGGRPDFAEIDPLLLTMPDNRYWTLGKYAGDAWRAGKNLMDQSQTPTQKGRK